MSILVIDGEYKDLNDIQTLDQSTKKEYGPFDTEAEADDVCKSLIQRNIDNYYNRAWVIKKD